MAPDLSKEELKAVFKEAMKEWMNEKYTDFGKWSAVAVGCSALAALMYFVFWIEGFRNGH